MREPGHVACRQESRRTTGVSFVLPVYNGERTLAEVLQSVVAQRWEGPVEWIAVDDGSEDGSRAILEQYVQSHGLKVLEGPRRGAAAALNLAVSSAKHPWVCQVDQDVVLLPGWLEK